MSGQFYLAVLGDLVEHRATGTLRAAIALRMAQLRFACPSPKHRFNGQTVSKSRFY